MDEKRVVSGSALSGRHPPGSARGIVVQVYVMTTGSRSMGSEYSYGPITSKVWSGTDYASLQRPTRWPPLNVVDDNGTPLKPGDNAYHAGVIRARAAAIRANRAKSKRLQTEDHAYNCSWTSHVNGQLSFTSGATYTYPFLSMFGKAGVTFEWSANDDIKLVNKLRAKLQGSDFNLGVFLAEAPMAVQMIGDAAFRIAESIRYARRGNFREAARSISKYQRSMGRRDVIASNLLELQYGWKPLMSDMVDGAEFLAHQLYHSPQHVVKVSRRVMGSLSAPLFGVDEDASYAFVRKSIIARISEVDQVKLAGITDVASIIWEKIPGSFLLDWSVPIGDFLAARGVSNSLQGTFVTTRVERYFWRPRVDSFQYDGLTWFGAQNTTCSGGTMSRSIGSLINVPMPEFKPLAKLASWQHAMNGVAVLQQAASSRMRRG